MIAELTADDREVEELFANVWVEFVGHRKRNRRSIECRPSEGSGP